MNRKRIIITGLVSGLLLLVIHPVLAQYNQGYAQYQAGQYADAAKTLESVVSEDPGNLGARYILGLCYLNLGMNQEARRELSAAVEGRPQDGKAQTNLSRALVRLQAHDEAVAAASKGVELTGDSGAYNALGLAYLGKGDYDKAEAAFGKAIEKNPRNAWAYNNRAYALILKGKANPRENAHKVHEYASKAVELDPANAIFQRNKAYAEEVLKKE